MNVDEFLRILDDGNNYELIDGVVVGSPSPSSRHQHITGVIFRLLANFLDEHPVGIALVETDMHLGQGPTGKDLVYKPEILFVRAERLHEIDDLIVGPPDLVVEVISRGSRRFDTGTKLKDYERFGVREYWLIDPEREAMTFYRLDAGRFIQVAPDGERLHSAVVPGFSLDLSRVRKAFRPW